MHSVFTVKIGQHNSLLNLREAPGRLEETLLRLIDTVEIVCTQINLHN